MHYFTGEFTGTPVMLNKFFTVFRPYSGIHAVTGDSAGPDPQAGEYSLVNKLAHRSGTSTFGDTVRCTSPHNVPGEFKRTIIAPLIFARQGAAVL